VETNGRNATRYWSHARIPGLTCLQADFTSHVYAPHTHDAFVVAVTEAGGSEFTSRGMVEEATPAVLLVFNPDEPHSGRMGRSRRWRYRSHYLSAAGIGHVASRLGIAAPSYFMRNAFTDPDLITAFRALHRAEDDDALASEEALLDGFGLLFARHGSGGPPVPAAPRDRAKLRQVLDALHDRHGESLTLDDLGAPASLSPYQLIGLFKRSLGLTPHAYLTQVRLKAAMAHLRGGKPIAEAATLAGFYDQAALNKHLKRSHGVTPRQYALAVGARNFDQ
jgi:AraC-like DNA-binding protein